MSTDLFASVVSDIKNYEGKDPLRPWLQGIKKMHACLPAHVLKEKLPRFLQKCLQTFQSDRRYRNDSRYVGVWIQLMDFVEDPKALLRMMEKNEIGAKRAAYYMAYAIFYEKKRDIGKAEKMYHLGVKNLAEPAIELQKAYEQFLHRVELYKRRKAKTEERKLKELVQASHLLDSKTAVIRIDYNGMEANFKSSGTGVDSRFNEPGHNNTENCLHLFKGKSHLGHHISTDDSQIELSGSNLQLQGSVSGSNRLRGSTDSESLLEVHREGDLGTRKDFPGNDDTIVATFVGSAIVGKSDTEDACHHGLVDPTINMKEAMNAISNMFREPLEIDTKVKRKPRQSNGDNQLNSGFQVFVDDSEDQVNIESRKGNCAPKGSSIPSVENPEPLDCSLAAKRQLQGGQVKPSREEFKILADDDEEEDEADGFVNHDYLNEGRPSKGPQLPNSFPSVKDTQKPSCVYEDTVIRRFVGSTIHDEPEVENACHHGLVDPTVNLKEAMDDINSMFGEPLNFVRPSRSRKQENLPVHNREDNGFSILMDEEVEEQPNASALPGSSQNSAGENGLFEPTICMKEAMAEINAMFGMAMDF